MILPSLDDTLALAHFLESSAVETVVLLNISLPCFWIHIWWSKLLIHVEDFPESSRPSYFCLAKWNREGFEDLRRRKLSQHSLSNFLNPSQGIRPLPLHLKKGITILSSSAV